MAKSTSSKTSRGASYSKFRQKTLRDPYISDKGLKEPAICTVCGAIYAKKSWSFDPKKKAKYEGDSSLLKVVCPADRKIKDDFAMGFVNIKGKFVALHKSDIINTIKAEGERVKTKNPEDRIISVKSVPGGITVKTTSDKLALKIGKVLKNSFKGEHQYAFRYGDKHVEVDWIRDA